MQVLKRGGERVDVSFDKVLQRIRKASRGLTVNPDILAQQVLARIVDGIKTSDLDELTAQMAASLCTTHPDWGTLASRISISNHHKNTSSSFSEVVHILSNQLMPKTGEKISYLNTNIVELMAGPLADKVNAYIKYERDYEFDYFGFKTLEKSYLLKDSSMRVVERPQHMWMRVALCLWGHESSLDKAFETYDLLSHKFLTHATPTLFNAGTPRPQLSSCYLLSMSEDSIAGIYKTLGDCAAISKYAGGIGLHVHNIRARGSLIRGTNGSSNGLVPMLRVFNNTARYVDQCFTPDTLVFTAAGPKAIEDIGVTDRVLTSTGSYEAVRLPIRHDYKGAMLDIQVKNAVYPVRVTPEHQVLALQGQTKGLNFDVIRNRLEKNIKAAEFVDARDLVVGDFLVFPIPSYEADIPSISEEDCRFYGILLGDGHISGNMAGVCLNNTSKADVVTFVTDYLVRRGITPNISEEGNCTVHMKWSSNSPGFKFTKAQLYDPNKQKKMDTAFLHLPIAKVKQIVRGVIETDGCVGTKEIAIELSSYPLIEDVRYLLLRLGALASGYERNRVGSVSSTRDIFTTLPTAVVRVPRIPDIMEMFPKAPQGEFFSFLRHENNLYSRIQEITETTYEGTVHDFEIEGPHDYVVAHMGVVHNGGGRRNGSFAIYLEPWHADIEDFLKLKLNSGSEEERARDLFYALWISDLFMRRVEADAEWSLFCPSEAPGLADVYGPEFDRLYEGYEADGRARRTVSARKLWFQILDTQMETGTPYLLYKDPANQKSNQKNLGTIKSSNLCTEIIEYSSPEETAVCNLASLALPAFVGPIAAGLSSFDFEALRKAVRVAVRNLNRVIDVNFYPTVETERSNLRHRPIGLGVQGLADVFAILGLAWESDEAAALNQRIFEHLYYAAVDESATIALVEGAYSTFEGSPVSKGQLQPDLWSITPLTETDKTLDWASLRVRAAKGIRNSLLVAPMPTASTSQILGYNECFEPFTTNIYTRRTLAGEFIVINKYLTKELLALGLWTDAMKQGIVARNGSVQGIPGVPEAIQARYKTSWEIPQKTLIDMAAARGAFICQSQSLNLFVADPNYARLTSMHFYAWKKGLKTGCYYLRTKAPVAAQKFTVDPRLMAALDHQSTVTMVQHLPDEAYESDSDDSDDDEVKVAPAIVETRQQKLDRLAREYEEEQAVARAAAENGEGCLHCSA
jgi:ribonucleoside-diphosphate reductase alpha chain